MCFSNFDSERFIGGYSKIAQVINITTGEIEKQKDFSKMDDISIGHLYKLRDNKTILFPKGQFFYLFNFEDDTTSSYIVDRRGVGNMMLVDDETIAGTVSN